MLQAHAVRMQLPVVGIAGGFVPQQIAVGARVKIRLVAVARLFAHRQGDGAIGISGANRRHNGAKAIIGKIRVLAALQHKGAKPQPVSFGTAGENLVIAQPVAGGTAVTAANSAIIAIVFAVIGKFDQPAYIYLVAVHGTTRRVSRLRQRRIVSVGGQQRFQRFVRQIVPGDQRGNRVKTAHTRPRSCASPEWCGRSDRPAPSPASLRRDGSLRGSTPRQIPRF